MEEIFPNSLLITQQVTQNDTTNDTPTVAPIVNSRHQKPKDEEYQHPTANLLIDGLSIRASPTFPVVKTGANQTADSG